MEPTDCEPCMSSLRRERELSICFFLFLTEVQSSFVQSLSVDGNSKHILKKFVQQEKRERASARWKRLLRRKSRGPARRRKGGFLLARCWGALRNKPSTPIRTEEASGDTDIDGYRQLLIARQTNR